MSKQNNGGPAFPHSARLVAPDTYEHLTHGGMSLRDYFAAKAMQGLLANTLMGDASLHARAPDWLADISVGAYEFADAMLRARESS